ncbi:Uncharacterised protein [Sphingobacterium multivorum]|jgi:hypothetical protein|uniref:Uncharacterized protein n=1 Tax=Sphingobacterium multivorum TaxID=28454 RepID=A0A2X2IQQ2_SPHMU|nr:Uncharacterised protein [Sphingobacterium multivorum]SUJ08695.1 Uncharacterised protein [Sphingobacterium multivorum]
MAWTTGQQIVLKQIETIGLQKLFLSLGLKQFVVQCLLEKA